MMVGGTPWTTKECDDSGAATGNGERYVAAVVAHARETFEHRRLRVTIAWGNERAFRVWSGVGFVEVVRFVSSRTVMGTNEFVVLEFA
ncbi:MAG: hypothetical protein BMS9Abin12_0362 [Acidimicrobiia bacterium]|nr:MAG: hypothetical protein BMS9Abin12_0362 [Acidimicrobiia bacterium]